MKKELFLASRQVTLELRGQKAADKRMNGLLNSAGGVCGCESPLMSQGRQWIVSLVR